MVNLPLFTGFFTSQVVGNGISEPSTVYLSIYIKPSLWSPQESLRVNFPMRGACFEAQYACCDCGGGCFFFPRYFPIHRMPKRFQKTQSKHRSPWTGGHHLFAGHGTAYLRYHDGILEISWHWDMKPLLKWRGLCSVFVALSELICKGFCWFVGLQSVVQNAPTPQVVSSGSVVPAPQKAPVQVPCPFLESCILKTPGMEITRASCLSDNSIGILDMGYCSNIRSQFHVTIIISY